MHEIKINNKVIQFNSIKYSKTPLHADLFNALLILRSFIKLWISLFKIMNIFIDIQRRNEMSSIHYPITGRPAQVD